MYNEPVCKDHTHPNFQLFQKYISSLANIIFGEKKARRERGGGEEEKEKEKERVKLEDLKGNHNKRMLMI